MTSWVCSDCIDTSVLIRCTIATTTQASFHFLCCWLFSHSALIHVIVFSWQGGTITPHVDPIIISSLEGFGMLQSYAIARHRNNKLQLRLVSADFCLVSRFPFETYRLSRQWQQWESSQMHLRTILFVERHNSAQTHILRNENCKSKLCDISVECFRGPNCFMTFRRCLQYCIKKPLRSIGCTYYVRGLCPSMWLFSIAAM